MPTRLSYHPALNLILDLLTQTSFPQRPLQISLWQPHPSSNLEILLTLLSLTLQSENSLCSTVRIHDHFISQPLQLILSQPLLFPTLVTAATSSVVWCLWL